MFFLFFLLFRYPFVKFLISGFSILELAFDAGQNCRASSISRLSVPPRFLSPPGLWDNQQERPLYICLVLLKVSAC